MNLKTLQTKKFLSINDMEISCNKRRERRTQGSICPESTEEDFDAGGSPHGCWYMVGKILGRIASRFENGNWHFYAYLASFSRKIYLFSLFY